MVTTAGGFPPLPDFPPIPYPDFLPMGKYPEEILQDTKKRTEEIFDHCLKNWIENFERAKK